MTVALSWYCMCVLFIFPFNGEFDCPNAKEPPGPKSRHMKITCVNEVLGMKWGIIFYFWFVFLAIL